MTSQSTPDPLSPLSLSTRPVGEEKQHTDSPTSPASPSAPRLRTRTSTTASVASNASSRIRAASIKLLEADPPPGFMAGIGSHASKAPTLPDIRRGSYSKDGWSPIAGSGSEKGRREGVQGNRSAGVIGTSDSQDQAATAARPGLSARDRKKSGSPTSNSGIEPFPTLLEETNHSAASTRVGNSEVQMEQDAKEQARGGVHTDSHLDRDMSEKTTDRDSPVTASPKKDEVCALYSSSYVLFLTLYLADFAAVDPSAKATLDNEHGHRPPGVLEMGPHNTRLSYHCLWSECRGLGWNALPPLVQCCACNVQTQLRRYQFPAPHMDRDRLTDTQRTLLRYGLWTRPVEIPRSVLVGLLAAGKGS